MVVTLTRDHGDTSTFGGDDDTARTIISDHSDTSLGAALITTNGSTSGKGKKDMILGMFRCLQAERDDLRRKLHDEVANRLRTVDQKVLEHLQEAGPLMRRRCLEVERKKAAIDLSSEHEKNRNERDAADYALSAAAYAVSRATKANIRSAQRAQRCNRQREKKTLAELEKTKALAKRLSDRVRELEEALEVERRSNSCACDQIRTTALEMADMRGRYGG